MAIEARDRQGQVDLCETCEAIDLVGSVALNARQPGPLPVSASQTVHPSASPETTVVSVSLSVTSGADGAAQSGQDKSSVGGSEIAATQQTQEAAPDKITPAAEPPSKDDPEIPEGGTVGSDGATDCNAAQDASPPSAAHAAICQVASLQQLLRAKNLNLALVSDVDEQLLLNISFKQPVRLTAFAVCASAPPSGFATSVDEEDSVSGPMLVKVYSNKGSLNFCGVVEEACAFSVSLSDEDVLQGRRIALPGSKFQMCSSVQFFIQENLSGTAYTFLNKLALYGVVHKQYL